MKTSETNAIQISLMHRSEAAKQTKKNICCYLNNKNVKQSNVFLYNRAIRTRHAQVREF